MSAADYARAISRSNLPRKESIVSLIRTGLALRTKRLGRSKPTVGRSRLGGFPDLPPGFEWPAWRGKPQEFIAQINLAELPPSVAADRDLLPATGRLYFFYDQGQETWGFDPQDRGSFWVYYSDEPDTALSPAGPPDGRGDGTGRPLAVTTFEPIQTIPSFDSPFFERLGLGDDFIDQYIQIIESEERRVGLIEGDEEFGIDEDGPFHQVLGHPRTVQGSMEYDCELVRAGLYCGTSQGYTDPRAKALKPNFDEWVLLLQVDSDENAGREDDGGWIWGDVGRIYYWVRRDDLRARRFDNAWLILQCS
jgi:uncharacterized protein YwqG